MTNRQQRISHGYAPGPPEPRRRKRKILQNRSSDWSDGPEWWATLRLMAILGLLFLAICAVGALLGHIEIWLLGW